MAVAYLHCLELVLIEHIYGFIAGYTYLKITFPITNVSCYSSFYKPIKLLKELVTVIKREWFCLL